MLSCCMKCRKNAQRKNSGVVKTKHGRIMLLSKCSLCISKKSKFLKEQEAKGLLSIFGIKTPLNQTLLLRFLWF